MAHSNVSLEHITTELDLAQHHHDLPHLSYLLLIAAIITVMAWKSKSYLIGAYQSKAQYIPLSLILDRTESPIHVPCANTEKCDRDPAASDQLSYIIKSISTKSMILNTIECCQLNEYLPVRLASKSWSLIFSTAIHGRSLAKFYRATESLSKDQSVVLLIKDTLGAVFGAFCPVPWVQSSTHIGNGETFTFRLRPEMRMFPWTRDNAFFVIGQKKYIAVGGGSRFALWLDESFEKGSSGVCETFHNPVLSTTPLFDCSLVELWAI